MGRAASELRISESVPQPLRDAPSIIGQVVALQIVTDLLNIVYQQGKCIGVKTRIDRLWEIDNPRLVLPVQDVVGRQIAMDNVVGQPEFNITHESTEHCSSLVQ